MGCSTSPCSSVPARRNQSGAQSGAGACGASLAQYRLALVAYFARRLSSPDEAEDLAHEVIIRLLRRQEQSSISALRPYVFEVARTVLIDRLRRNRSRCVTDHEPLTEAIPDAAHFECERALMAREDVESVRNSLSELPDRTRSIFILRRVEGMKHQEIAGNLGVSLSTVEKHVRIAMLHIKERLENAV